jgi:hypothetical protein
MEEQLASLTAEQRATLTDTERDYHQRAASSRATRDLGARAKRDAWARGLVDATSGAERKRHAEEREARLRATQHGNRDQLCLILPCLPGGCKESPPAHYRRYKPRGLTRGFLQFCEGCDRFACRVHDGNRNRGGLQCRHHNKNYFFTMLEVVDRTFLFFPSEPDRLVVRGCTWGEPLSEPCLVAWVNKERVKELPWFDPSGLPEAELRQRLADLLVR